MFGVFMFMREGETWHCFMIQFLFFIIQAPKIIDTKSYYIFHISVSHTRSISHSSNAVHRVRYTRDIHGVPFWTAKTAVTLVISHKTSDLFLPFLNVTVLSGNFYFPDNNFYAPVFRFNERNKFNVCLLFWIPLGWSKKFTFLNSNCVNCK